MRDEQPQATPESVQIGTFTGCGSAMKIAPMRSRPARRQRQRKPLIKPRGSANMARGRRSPCAKLMICASPKIRLGPTATTAWIETAGSSLTAA